LDGVGDPLLLPLDELSGIIDPPPMTTKFSASGIRKSMGDYLKNNNKGQ
jgi:hypothetical protein